MMTLPTINFEHIAFLIESANAKIDKFNKKIERIELKILELKLELDMVAAMVEYLSAHDTRAKLVEMFYVSGEYGTAPKEDKNFLEIFERRKRFIEDSIVRCEHQAQKRKEQIEFMKNDLVLLEKMKGFNSLYRYRDAACIDL